METIKVADITTNQLLNEKGLFEEIISQGFEYIRFDKDISDEYNLPEAIFKVSEEGIHTRETLNLEGYPLEFIKISLSIEEIEAQEREEKACTETNDTLLFMTIIFEKLHAINEKGYYTTWFEYAGHTKDLSIKIIKGEWKMNKPAKVLMEGMYGIKGNTITDMFSMKKCTRREFLTGLDGFTKKPTKKGK